MSLPPVARVGYGAMNLTWKPQQTPDEQAFKAILQAIESANGQRVLLNSGEFYGSPEPTLNLSLLSRFYKAHPEATEKTFLSVKGGIKIVNKQMAGPDGSLEGLRNSVTNINSVLASEGGQKKMDLFEMARVDRKTEIEDTMKHLLTLKDEGHFQYIGLSEVSAKTIERAAKVATIAAVEVEYSLWALDIEKNGVLSTCINLDIPVVAYSPLGRGFLTGSIKSPDDLPEGDMRRGLDRFKKGAFEQNYKIVEKIRAFAEKRQCSPAQVSIAWVLAQNKLCHPIPGSTRPEGVKEAFDALKVSLTDEDLRELRELAESVEIVGGRYNDHSKALLEG